MYDVYTHTLKKTFLSFDDVDRECEVFSVCGIYLGKLRQRFLLLQPCCSCLKSWRCWQSSRKLCQLVENTYGSRSWWWQFALKWTKWNLLKYLWDATWDCSLNFLKVRGPQCTSNGMVKNQISVSTNPSIIWEVSVLNGTRAKYPLHCLIGFTRYKGFLCAEACGRSEPDSILLTSSRYP